MYNEEAVIRGTLSNLEALTGDFEAIIVDGGSSDKTIDLICETSLDTRLIKSKNGRAQQLNQGASTAKGDTLLFLHADCTLPKNAVKKVENALAENKYVGGGFSLALDDQALIYKLIAYFSNLRVRYFGHFFGDQAIFIRREVFRELGGFRDLELMEDMDFSQRVKKRGRMVQLPTKVISSARRWKKNGVWRTIWLMQKIKLLYFLGVNPSSLKGMYADIR